MNDYMKAERIKPNRRYLTIFSTMVNEGLTPWGAKLGDGSLSLCGGDDEEEKKWILCDGYTLTPKEAQELVEAKLLQGGEPDHFGRPTLGITEQGRRWLTDKWDALKP
jgi:hypothetical protein